jgi:hypothetical protein
MSARILLLPGDVVEVLSPAEIRQTLDENGAFGGLPFMPEMVQFCGRRFRVLRRIEKTCYEAPEMELRAFPQNDVVFLEGLRCSGEAHGNCNIGCMIFWKEAWLRKVDSNSLRATLPDPGADAKNQLTAALKTTQPNGRYYCQATQLGASTHFLNRWQRLWKAVRDVRVKTYTAVEMFGWMTLPIIRKIIRKVKGDWPVGTQAQTPVETLNLQAGEWVEIKPFSEIVLTLDDKGKNRGLHFSKDMAVYCGRRFKVRNRLDRMILESSGEMRALKNTVILDGVQCDCIFTLGGCPRASFQYWREIWLKRVERPEPAPLRPNALTSQNI